MVEARRAESSRTDSIYVRASSSGAGAITVLILDGKGICSRLDNIWKSTCRLRDAASGELLLGRLIDAERKPIDEVVLSVIGEKDSPTGNPQVELSCHGGEGTLAAVEELLRGVGIARGRDTELLERAHFRGKLPLLILEARLRLSSAATQRQAEFLIKHSAFQQRWERLGFDMALCLRNRDESFRPRIVDAARVDLKAAGPCLALLARHRVALCGPVNAGKSTLANALAGAQRHIVSAIPGTTVDRVESSIAVRGLNVLLTDTAGLRSSSCGVEAEGQARAHGAAAEADLRVLVLDGSRAPEEHELEAAARIAKFGPLLLALNKADLGTDETARGVGFLIGSEPIAISARDGSGVERLAEKIEHALLGGEMPETPAPFTRRQVALLEKLIADLEQGVHGGEAIVHLRRLIGTSPDPEQLAVVLAEK